MTSAYPARDCSPFLVTKLCGALPLYYLPSPLGSPDSHLGTYKAARMSVTDSETLNGLANRIRHVSLLLINDGKVEGSPAVGSRG